MILSILSNLLLSAMILLSSLVVQAADQKLDLTPEQIEDLTCTYLTCGYKSMMLGQDEQEAAACLEQANILQEIKFQKNYFAQIEFWLNHNTKSEILKMCPNHKKAIDGIVAQTEKVAPGAVAKIEKWVIENRERNIADLKARANGSSLGDSSSQSHIPGQLISPMGPNEIPAMPSLKDLMENLSNEQLLMLSLEPNSPVPLIPALEKSLKCELALCNYFSERNQVDEEKEASCDKVGQLLLSKSFNGQVLKMNQWLKAITNKNSIINLCPDSEETFRKMEKASGQRQI